MARGEQASDAVLAFFDDVAARMLGGDPRMRLLGPRNTAIDHLARYERDPQTRSWNMQQNLSTAQLRQYAALNADSRARGTDLRLLVPHEALRRSPLHTCIDDPVRVGSVPRPMLVVDDALFLAGPPGTELLDTFWTTEDPALVQRGARTYLTAWDAAVPSTEVVDRPPLPPRAREVALWLVEGASDKEIAEALGVSERTVSAEVRRVVSWLGARSRGHAIAVLVGAG